VRRDSNPQCSKGAPGLRPGKASQSPQHTQHFGGDDPIRTDGAFRGHSALAVRRLRPLGHVSMNFLVGMERFELSCSKALVSKTSVSPIFTTSPLLNNSPHPEDMLSEQVHKDQPVDKWWAPRDSNPENVTALEAAASSYSARSPKSKSPSIFEGLLRLFRTLPKSAAPLHAQQIAEAFR
jgi:hypothetical protein